MSTADDKKVREIYEDLIKPGLCPYADARPLNSDPVAVLSAGQPGSGRGDNIRAIRNEFAARGGIVVVDPDELQARHPAARTMAPAELRQDLGRLMQQTLGDAVRDRYNIVVKTRLDSSDANLASIRSLKEAAYRVEIRALAVPLQDSYRVLLARQASLKEAGLPAPAISKAEHDAAANNLPKTIDRIEADLKADRVAIYRRDQQLVYDNRQEQGRWLITPPIGASALAIERERPRTLDELQQRLAGWAALRELVGKDARAMRELGIDEALSQAQVEVRERALRSPPARGDALAASLREAADIAKRFGGDNAQVLKPLLGTASHGPILGVTAEHVLQATPQSNVFIAHSKRDLAITPALAETVEIRYGRHENEQATVARSPAPVAARGQSIPRAADADQDLDR
ncbi:MAG: zeta toxin family protein [Hyphomicrobium sp.]|nr:zeta toxin family protein [Hyphomicrobium sp.]